VTFPASIGTSTYAGADTSGTTTLLSRIGGSITISGGKVAATVATGDDADAAAIKTTIGVAGAGLTAVGDTAGHLDADVSTRSTYAGADTSGTTTLLAR
jgi:ribulose-5-phosphate 4-epimerase/fuculose-1-phosphate aldolase